MAQRKRNFDRRARSRRRIHGEAAAQVADSLFDAQQPHAALAACVESAAVVVDREPQAVRLLPHRNFHVLRAGVLPAVVQGFLHDAIDAGLVLFRKLFGNPIGRNLHPQATALGNLARLPFERRDQAEVVEHRRTQQQRHVAHHADGVLHLVFDPGRFFRHGFQLAIADQRGEIGHLHQYSRQRLAHLVVQLARNRTPFLFLGLHQPRGERLQFLPRPRDLVQVRGRLVLQAEDAPHARSGQQQAQSDGESQNQSEAAAELRERRFHPHFSGVQLSFVERANLVGQPQHRHAAREDLVAQENVAVAPAFGRAPCEDRIEHAPIGRQILREYLEWPGFRAVHQFPVFVESRVHVAAAFEQAIAVAFRFAAFRLQQVVADVRAGDVEVGANAVEHPRPPQKIFADFVIAPLNLRERLHAVEFGEGHQQQQTAEAGHEDQAAIGGQRAIAGNRNHLYQAIQVLSYFERLSMPGNHRQFMTLLPARAPARPIRKCPVTFSIRKTFTSWRTPSGWCRCRRKM